MSYSNLNFFHHLPKMYIGGYSFELPSEVIFMSTPQSLYNTFGEIASEQKCKYYIKTNICGSVFCMAYHHANKSV